jgi:predicted DNA-binding protein
MEAKMEKRHTIRMTETTARRLKVMAAQVGKPQGKVLEALLLMVADGRLGDEDMAKALTENFMRGYTLPQGSIR